MGGMARYCSGCGGAIALLSEPPSIRDSYLERAFPNVYCFRLVGLTKDAGRSSGRPVTGSSRMFSLKGFPVSPAAAADDRSVGTVLCWASSFCTFPVFSSHCLYSSESEPGKEPQAPRPSRFSSTLPPLPLSGVIVPASWTAGMMTQERNYFRYLSVATNRFCFGSSPHTADCPAWALFLRSGGRTSLEWEASGPCSPVQSPRTISTPPVCSAHLIHDLHF